MVVRRDLLDCQDGETLSSPTVAGVAVFLAHVARAGIGEDALFVEVVMVPVGGRVMCIYDYSMCVYIQTRLGL